MATSSAKLSEIINCLCKEYELDEKQVLKKLSTQDLLPAKLLNKPNKSVSLFASKIAEEMATQSNIVVEEGKGTGKDNKFTLTDIKKLIQQPSKKKLLVSPTALNYANEHGINVTNIVGTGKDGRIILKDVENIVETTADDDDELDTPATEVKNTGDSESDSDSDSDSESSLF